MALGMTARFQVIGSCVRTQTFTWDERIDLTKGILYDISFEQNFLAVHLYNQVITEMSIASILSLITKKEQGYIFKRHDPRISVENQPDNRILDCDDYEDRKVSKRKERKRTERGLRKLSKVLSDWGIECD